MEVNLIVNLGLNSGIGRYSTELYRILSGRVRSLNLYSNPYSHSNVIPISNVLSKHFAKNIICAPLVDWRNTILIKRSGILKDKNLHLVGSNYALCSESNNVIMTVHEYYFILKELLNTRNLKDGVKQLAFDYTLLKLRKQISFAQAVVAPSKYAANQIHNAFGIRPIVIHETVDKSKFFPRDKRSARMKLGLPLHKKFILNVSGGGLNKNLSNLTRIAGLLPKEYLILKIGSPISNKNAINLHNVSELAYPLYFAASDLYINTSTQEGFNIPLLESISSGLPVVSNKCATATEILADSALYVKDSNNPFEYVSKIIQAVENGDLNERASNCINRSLLFNEEIAAKSYLDLYSKVFS